MNAEGRRKPDVKGREMSLDDRILERFQLLTEDEKVLILVGLIESLSGPAADTSDPRSDSAAARSA